MINTGSADLHPLQEIVDSPIKINTGFAASPPKKSFYDSRRIGGTNSKRVYDMKEQDEMKTDELNAAFRKFDAVKIAYKGDSSSKHKFDSDADGSKGFGSLYDRR